MKNTNKSVNNDAKRDKMFRAAAYWAVVSAIAAYVIGLAFAGRYAGGALFAAVTQIAALILLLYAAFCLLHRRLPRLTKLCRAVWHSCAALAAAVFVVTEIIIIANSGGDYSDYENAPSDCMIILGAGLNGYTPSLSLASRLDEALRQLEVRPDMTVVVSGGQGPGELVTEARAMRDYLVAGGFPPENIIMEERSTNTAQNAAYSMEILRGLEGFDDSLPIIVCSNSYHLFRAKYLMSREGADAVTLSAPVPRLYLVFTGYFREFFSVMFMWRAA